MEPSIDPEEAERRQSILRFWRDVEMFDINQIDRQRDSRDQNGKLRIRRSPLSRGDELPWMPDAKTHIPDSDDHMWFHLVYGGMAGRLEMVSKIKEALCPDSELVDDESGSFDGETWTFAMMLTSTGRPFLESYTLANYAVATRIAQKGGNPELAVKAIRNATQNFRMENPDTGLTVNPPSPERKTLPGMDDDDDREESGGSDWTYGENVMDWERFDGQLALRNGLLGSDRNMRRADMVVISVRMDKPKPDVRGRIGKQRIPDWSVLNSFYLDGIQTVLNDGGKAPGTALESYISKPVAEIDRVDLIADPVELARAASPASMPLGRWPANPKHSLMLGQQAAVGEIVSNLNDGPGLVAVNGPPGSGKSTTLRDIIAHVVTSRALAISKLDFPQYLFEKDWVASGEKRIMVPRKELVAGFGIVVASANNAAVDNISREIPLEEAIDRESFPNASYLPDLASLVSDRRSAYEIRRGLKRDLEGKPAWGLLAAAFGRKSNIYSYFSKVLAGRGSRRDVVQVNGLMTELGDKAREMQMTGRDWHVIRKDFLRQVERINSSRKKLVDGETELYAVANSKAEMTALEVEKAALEKRLKKPRKSDTKEHREQIDKRLGVIGERISQLVWQDINSGDDPLRGHVTFPDDEFMAATHEERQSSTIWSNSAYDAARSRLFALSLELIEATIAENRFNIVENLKQLKDHLIGAGEQELDQEGVRGLWDTLFLVTPAVSTTLASLGRNFATTGPGYIGWMLIDEAGQAAPQIVTEALWRSKRAVIIGDPRQIEPVMTTPVKLIESFREKHGVDLNYSPAYSSAQVVADQTMKKGSLIQVGTEKPVWTGVPLRAHRRCVEPMFSISNTVAYGGQMVQTTPDCRLEGRSLGQSSWLDLSDPVSHEGKVVHDELELLRSCFEVMADDWPEKDGIPSDVFVITPFRDVASAINRQIWSLEAPGRIEAGTIHTFQGKEADIVFVVLGSTPGEDGRASREWVGRTPNMLNVAVTRARSRLHIIGSREDWAGIKTFDALHRIMEDQGRIVEITGTEPDDVRAALGFIEQAPAPA